MFMLIVSMVIGAQCLLAAQTPADVQKTPPETVVERSTSAANPYAAFDSVRAATFEASDSLLAGVWDRALDALAEHRAAAFSDDLYGARGPFWGDAALIGRSYRWLTADKTLSRAAIAAVLHPRFSPEASTARIEHRALAEYSLLWPGLLLDDYRHTGDRAYAKAMAEAVLEDLFGYFDGFKADSGLLLGESLDGEFQEWPEGLRIGVDYENAARAENAVLNAFYYHALVSASHLAEALGFPSVAYRNQAQAVRRAYAARLWDEDAGLFIDAPTSTAHSLAGNALALCFGLVDEEDTPGVIQLIRERGTDCAPDFAPYVVEACFKAGEPQLGYDLITFLDADATLSSPIYLIAEYVAGLTPAAPGWSRAAIAPRFPIALESAKLSIPVTGGRVTLRYARNVASILTVAPGVQVQIDAREGEPVMSRNAISHAEGHLSPEQLERLEAEGWSERTGEDPAVWVSVAEQMLRYIRAGEVIFQARCASSEKGIGSLMDSLQTPTGWHSVVRKVGDDAPWGQVFRSRQATREIWQPGENTTDDMVLTRVLLLTGEEPGKNKGGNVDSYARNIYIHGTNDEARIGTPSSHGCVRLTNDDILEAFRLIPKGALVLITEY